MTVRGFIEEDRESLRRVYLETRRQVFPWLEGNSLKSSDFDKDTAGERIWVFEQAGRAVGFISASEADNFIHHLFILPQFFGIGGGSQLLQACLANIGYPARLECVAQNVDALEFYRSKGWHTVSKGLSADGEYHLVELT